MNDAAAERFAADLAALSPPGTRLGLAVSGGPDSMALLLLALAVRPGQVEVATVDHRLRPDAAAEARQVAAVCAARGVAHSTLVARWVDPPTANVQALARDERYALLGEWAAARGLGAVATAHHADDQAETLLMRLARGSGVAGLGGLRVRRPLAPGVMLIRPLLDWPKAEVDQLVLEAGIAPVDDPANRDPRHDRARVRRWLAGNPDLDPVRLATAASALRDANDAIDWALAPLIETRLKRSESAYTVDVSELPRELQRRLALAAFEGLGAAAPRGPELMRALDALGHGRPATLGGLKLEPTASGWRFSPAPSRR